MLLISDQVYWYLLGISNAGTHKGESSQRLMESVPVAGIASKYIGEATTFLDKDGQPCTTRVSMRPDEFSKEGCPSLSGNSLGASNGTPKRRKYSKEGVLHQLHKIRAEPTPTHQLPSITWKVYCLPVMPASTPKHSQSLASTSLPPTACHPSYWQSIQF